MQTTHDYIIVGGGSAGCVLANRLSARSANRVLLCEAGEDTPDGRVPEAILDSRSSFASRNPRFLWNELWVTTEAIPHNDPDAPGPRKVQYEQARVLGGGSSVNAQLANRGSPHDYDEWEQRGARGWRWETVLPYFKKLERDIDFDGPLHGADGRIPVRRVFPENWSDYAKAVAEAFELAGYRYVQDQNGGFQDGYYPLVMSNLYDTRVSAAIAYLGPTVRQRKNLTILTETQVSELLFEDTRCVGIRAMARDQQMEFRASEVILCCGAIHSPAMLLRAGIGPVGHLRDLGIPIRVARPGVGQGLMDHPAISVASYLKPWARKNPYSKLPLQIGMRFSSGIDQMPPTDMALGVSNRAGWHAIGGRIAVITLWANKTFSETGLVRLSSLDWRQEPDVAFNLLSDHRDLKRLAKGFREIIALHELPPLKAVSCDAFLASFTDRARRLGTYNTKNRILTRVGAIMLDSALLRKFLIRGVAIGAAGPIKALEDDDTLEAYIKRAAIGVWHCSCSCRMGEEGDRTVVTDPVGRVYGVHGLRVVDASIFPVLPCANTNFPTMMVAEKIADEILHTGH